MKTIWRDNPPQTTNPLRFLLFASQPYHLVAFGALLAVIIAATVNAGTAYALKILVDAATHVSTGSTGTALWHAALLYIFVSVISGVAWRLSGFIGMYWATGVRATARYALTSYITKHSYQYFSDRFAGSIASKVSQAGNSLKDITEQILWQFAGFIVTMVASFAIAFIANPILAFIFLFWVLLVVPLNIYFARRRIPLSTATQKAETELGGATVDLFSNISAVYEYARRNFELARLATLIIFRRKTGLRNWRYGETVLLFNGLFQDVFLGGLILSAVYFVIHGIISPGDIALILTLVIVAEDRLTFLGNQINTFSDNWGQITESLEDILRPYEVQDEIDATQLHAPTGAIDIKNVSFNYKGVSVFENLSLTIPSGQKVGLVGRSGAGKSTLVKLLLRHYDLTEGNILIDNTDIASVTKESLRSNITVVPQEPLLFHRTIAENIAYGKLEASESEIKNAAALAQADEFIQNIPDGYGVLVGERGVKLSGGQRQRIAIARAFIKDAPILLLDEATSALDSESEIAVQKALLTLMEGRTVIAIAHRLSTLRAMNRIIVIDQGKIIEDGTHDELIKKGGLYADLWNHQAGGFLEE